MKFEKGQQFEMKSGDMVEIVFADSLHLQLQYMSDLCGKYWTTIEGMNRDIEDKFYVRVRMCSNYNESRSFKIIRFECKDDLINARHAIQEFVGSTEMMIEGYDNTLLIPFKYYYEHDKDEQYFQSITKMIEEYTEAHCEFL